MDLVTTPIEESAIFLRSTRPEAPESPYDPPSIPLPPSPSLSHLQTLSSSPSDPLFRTSTLKEEMQKLEDDLKVARRDLEEKELVLDELRNVVGDLQMQAQVRLSGRNEEVDEDSVEDTGNLFPLRDALH